MGQDSTNLGTEFMITIKSTRVAGSKIVFSCPESIARSVPGLLWHDAWWQWWVLPLGPPPIDGMWPSQWLLHNHATPSILLWSAHFFLAQWLRAKQPTYHLITPVNSIFYRENSWVPVRFNAIGNLSHRKPLQFAFPRGMRASGVTPPGSPNVHPQGNRDADPKGTIITDNLKFWRGRS